MLDKGQIRRNIKGMAKRMLKGSWGVALGVMIIPILVSSGFAALRLAVAAVLDLDQAQLSQGFLYTIPSARLTSYSLVNLILGIAQLALSIPITFGVISWFVSLTDGHRAPLSAAFRFLDNGRRYWKTITVSLLLYLKAFLYGLLFLCVPIALGLWLLLQLTGGHFNPYSFYYGNGLDFFYYGDQYAGLILLVSLVLFIAGIALAAVLMRYLPAFYLTIRNPSKPARQILAESVDIMRGHKLEALVFFLSYLGWMILSSLVWVPLSALLNLLLPWGFSLTALPFLAGLPLLFVSVYLEAGTVLFCEYVEDAARLRDGHTPYTVVQEEPRYSWNAEPQQPDPLTGDTTPITNMQDELWRHLPREHPPADPAQPTAQFETRELWQSPSPQGDAHLPQGQNPQANTTQPPTDPPIEEENEYGRQE